MFDVIGKRNWFFAFSLLITIPGLIFLLLGPVTGGKVGLQFAIDFTGGTVWTIRFADETVTPEQVQKVVAGQGFDSSVTKTGDGFIEIRTKEAALSAPAPVIAPAASPGASAAPRRLRPGRIRAASRPRRPGASASAGPAASASPGAAAGPAASASPSASASASPSASPSAAPGTVPGSDLPTSGKLGEVRVALEKALGPIAEQQSLSAVGAVVSSDLITQAMTLILFGSIGILLWITYRFRDFKMGVTALIALLHDVLVVVGAFAILGTFTGMQIDGLFVTAMLTDHRLLGPRHDRRLRPGPREPGPARRGAVRPHRQSLDPADLRPVDHHQPHGRHHAARPAAVRGRRDRHVRAGAAPRDHLGDVLVDLQREPSPRGLAPVGGPPAAPRRRGSPEPPRHHVIPGTRPSPGPGPSSRYRRPAAPPARQVATKPHVASCER